MLFHHKQSAHRFTSLGRFRQPIQFSRHRLLSTIQFLHTQARFIEQYLGAALDRHTEADHVVTEGRPGSPDVSGSGYIPATTITTTTGGLQERGQAG